MLNIFFSTSCMTVSSFFRLFCFVSAFCVRKFLQFMDNLYTLLLHHCEPVAGPTLLRPTLPQIKKGGSGFLEPQGPTRVTTWSRASLTYCD